MRSEEAFFDTNVLVYAFGRNDPRSDTAEQLLAAGGVVGVQNLNEFVAIAQRKLNLSWKAILHALDDIGTVCPDPVPVTIAIHQKAVEIAKQYRYHIYDSLLIAAALQASCRTLFSEDMQHGQTIESLTIRNPFRSTVN